MTAKSLGLLSIPAALRLDGLRFVIYPNDHPPAHVHVVGPDWEVVINLIGTELREAYSCTAADARRALKLVAKNREALLDAWRRIHG